MEKKIDKLLNSKTVPAFLVSILQLNPVKFQKGPSLKQSTILTLSSYQDSRCLKLS